MSNPLIYIREYLKSTKSLPPSKFNKGSHKYFGNKNRYILIILFITALTLRLYNLGYHSLWIDELLHANIALDTVYYHKSFWGIENNQIFIHFLNVVSCFLFGASDFTFRLPVAFLSAFGVPLIYLLGKKLFNKSVGLMSAVFFTGSQFLLVWGRIDRAYGLVPILYMAVILLFWYAFEQPDQPSDTIKNPVDKKYALYFIGAFVLAFLTQAQVLFFGFSVMFYGTFIFVSRFFYINEKQNYKDKYALLFYVNVIAIILLITPFLPVIVSPLVKYSFLPSYNSALALPNWDYLSKIMHSPNWNHTLMNYVNVTTNDFNYFYLIGYAGFFFAFYLKRKNAFFLFSLFVVPFLLMSFVFRDPNLGKYIAFYYPVFLISGSVTLYTVLYKIISEGVRKKMGISPAFATVLFLVLCVFFISFKDIHYMVTTKEYGNVFNTKLSEISFVPWKEASEYVLQHKTDEDIILCTLPQPPYYLKIGNLSNRILWFRQMRLNPYTRSYVPMDTPPANVDNALSYEGMVRLFKKYKRGWLMAHYYFDNVFTDPKVRTFCIENMDYHFYQNETGLVKIFSWDHSKPVSVFNRNLFVELGKPYGDQNSELLYVDIPSERLKAIKGVRVTVAYEGIDSGTEAAIIINNSQGYIPVTDSKKEVSGSRSRILQKDSIVFSRFFVDKSAFKEGRNEIYFNYTGKGDVYPGFVIYAMFLDYEF